MTPTNKYKAALISLGSISSKWTAEAMRKYFAEVDEIQLKDIEINFSGKTAEILYQGKPLKEYDCIFAKGSFRYAPLLQGITTLRQESCYMPVEATAFSVVHDKLLTQLALQQQNVPMPRTYQAATVTAAKHIMKSLNYPIIMKFPQGTGGKGVVFADSYSSASSILDALTALRQPFILQEFVETGGTDIRAIVIGKKVVAAMVRKADITERRSNIHSGGHGENIVLDELTKKLAVKVAAAVKADLCGVDILKGPKGPVVLEANISPGLQGVVGTTKIDVPDLMAKYLYERTAELREGQHKQGAEQVLVDEGLKKADTIITTLDFRGTRVLLPELLVKRAKLDEDENYEIKVKEGELCIKRFGLENGKSI